MGWRTGTLHNKKVEEEMKVVGKEERDGIEGKEIRDMGFDGGRHECRNSVSECVVLGSSSPREICQ